MPRPFGDEEQKEHQAELQEVAENAHAAQEAAKAKRQWWRFWTRDRS
jgi:hypothetical protein